MATEEEIVNKQKIKREKIYKDFSIKIKDACKKCGKCCSLIGLQKSMGYIEEYNKLQPEDEEVKFIMENFISLTDEEAESIDKKAMERAKVSGHIYFFKCKKLVENKCSAQGSKPRICWGFPNYDRTYILKQQLPNQEDCGYLEHIITPEELEEPNNERFFRVGTDYELQCRKEIL